MPAATVDALVLVLEEKIGKVEGESAGKLGVVLVRTALIWILLPLPVMSLLLTWVLEPILRTPFGPAVTG